MIAVRVQREPSERGWTPGALYINDCFVCWTLEDIVRETALGLRTDRVAWVQSWKVPGATAIPAGRYDLALEWSPKFTRILPELKGVPGFSEIKIHAGNRAKDTEGCIIVGRTRGIDQLYDSAAMLDDVLLRMMNPMMAERMRIDILNPPELHFTHTTLEGERFA